MLAGKKTYWAAALNIAGAAVAACTGVIGPEAAAQLIAAGVLAIFLRAGIAKGK